MDVAGKVVVVTGASAGIGAATARRFAEAGAMVILSARSKHKLDALRDELNQQGHRTVSIQADMRSREEVKTLIKEGHRHFGRIDILVNNAGQAAAGEVATVDPEDFRRIIDLNVFGALYAMQAVIPLMREVGGGIIINVGSMVSKLRLPGLGAYAATKSALTMLSDTARVELAADNIRVITMYPRMTATEFGKNSLGDQELRRRQRANLSRTPQPVDSAEAVAKRILEAARLEPEEQFMEG